MAIRTGTGELLALTRMGRGCCPTENDEPKCPQSGVQGTVQGRNTQPWSRSHICPYPYLAQATLPSKQTLRLRGATPSVEMRDRGRRPCVVGTGPGEKGTGNGESH